MPVLPLWLFTPAGSDRRLDSLDKETEARSIALLDS